MEITRTLRIVNQAGMHARPCHAIVALALEFEAELCMGCNGREVNGKSIIQLMTLGAGPDTELQVTVRGSDAEALIERLEVLIASGFDERS
ncbi:MAG: phosphotransferase system HPr (HPr) family protein [Chlamydiales bacterium]|jgi:phosphotransferase system HPr (HPr) family protein